MRLGGMARVHPVVFPAVLGVLMISEQLAVRPKAMGVAIAGAAVITVALSLRRTWPLAAILTVDLTLATEALLGVSDKNTSLPILPIFWATFLTFAVVAGRAQALAIGGLLTAAVIGTLFDGGHFSPSNLADNLLFALVLCVPAGVTGRYVKTRHHYTELVEQRAAALEAQREAETTAAVADERLRIAREMHDVISHSVGLMGVQAAAVRRRLDSDQGELSDVLLSVEETARTAIEELRRTLGVLRGNDRSVQTRPVSTAVEIPALVESAQSAGQSVTLSIEGDLATIPTGTSATVYRIAQEMVTNARKHASGQPLRLTVSNCGAEVVIEASNPSLVSTGGSGHGLIGMRERVAAFGGTLVVDATEDFTVRACVPTAVMDVAG